MSAQTAEILRQARALIERGWCQEAVALDSKSVVVDPISGDPVAVCVNGAIRRAVGYHWRSGIDDTPFRNAQEALESAAGAASIAVWNDAPKRTQAQVLALFDRAIAAE